MKNVTEARTDFSDLENLGWDFSDLYQGVADAREISIQEAEKWEKENYHVMLTVSDGWVFWQPCHNESGLQGDRQQASHSKSDNAESLRHVQQLHDSAGLWDIQYDEDAE